MNGLVFEEATKLKCTHFFKLFKMDDNFDYGPIRRSERLMTIRAREVSKKLGQALFKDTRVTIHKQTGNTVKRNSVTVNKDTHKLVYGSHSKKCFACSPSQKPLIGRRKRLQESSKNIINEFSDEDDCL
jgi:hypothetical protein